MNDETEITINDPVTLTYEDTPPEPQQPSLTDILLLEVMKLLSLE